MAFLLKTFANGNSMEGLSDAQAGYARTKSDQISEMQFSLPTISFSWQTLVTFLKCLDAVFPADHCCIEDITMSCMHFDMEGWVDRMHFPPMQFIVCSGPGRLGSKFLNNGQT